MQPEAPKHLFVVLLIAALHAPLFVYAMTLHERLLPGQSITTLSWPSTAVLAGLFVLPYAVLAVSRIRWNPRRSRLNEPNGL